MRLLLTLPILLLAACQKPAATQAPTPAENTTAQAPAEAPPVANPADPAALKNSVVRINSTRQIWNPGQPWEKNPPDKRRALAPIVGPNRVLTTAEMVADAINLELESTDGTRFTQAKIIAVDYEVNLALIAPTSDEEGEKFFQGTTPLEVAEPSSLGQTLEIYQVEDNGVPLVTTGTIRSIDVASNFLPGQSFLTYLVKASMQSAASSYSLPVLRQGRLAGMLISYDSKDQICDVAATDLISRFIKATASEKYQGIPSLGVAVSRTENPSFRQWLKLTDDQGGLYISTVRKGGAGDAAGVKKGDVLLAVDGNPIDRRGYYQHPLYGSLFWGHLIRGEKAAGETIKLSLLRDGQPLEITATLTREEEHEKLVPNHTFGRAPNFLVKGGFIFQELTRPLLEAYGENWSSNAPLNLLDAYENPDQYEGKVDRIIFLSGAIPTPATIGYERLRNLIVRKVNGKDITNMKSLIDAFDSNLQEIHSIEFDEDNLKIHLDETISTAVDSQLLQRGLPRLSRAE
jgi:S1-C subfamily serine protease